jgi:hypothetical protein
MVQLSITDELLDLEVKGVDKILAFKGSLQIPLRAIEDVRADPGVGRGSKGATRNPGIYIPGLIAAGTFYEAGKRVFWDVHHPEKAIIIKLKSGQYDILTAMDDRYDQIVVEVEDPAGAVATIESALARLPQDE